MKRFLPFLIILVVLGGALGVSLKLWKSRSAPNTNAEPTFATNLLGAAPANNGTDPNQANQNSAGLTRPNVKVSSPVVLEEYGDYQCPPCGQLYPELREIEKEYGNQVQIVFHHFPLAKIHKNALVAAHAAEAARNQNKFWEMHDRLYRNQKEWADQDDPRPILLAYARRLNLNIDQFKQDLESNLLDQRIS